MLAIVSLLNLASWGGSRVRALYFNKLKFSNSRCFSLQDFFPSSKLQNTRSLTFVGRLGRSRHNTIDIILIQWHVNEWPGILKWLLSFIKRALKKTFTKIFSILTDNPPKKWRFRTRCECKVWSNCDNIIWCLSHTWVGTQQYYAAIPVFS